MEAVGRGFFGWRVVAAVFVLAIFGWGIGFYGPPVFMHAVRERHGWPLGMMSAAVTVHFLAGTLVIASLPRLYARLGVAAVTKTGALVLATGIVGWATARAPWQLFGATLLSGAGWVALGAAAVNAIISPWFVRRRPAALALAYNGASVGGVLFSPLWVTAIERLGFASAAALIGFAMVLMVWILSDRFFSRTPDAMGQTPDGDPPSASGELRTVSDARVSRRRWIRHDAKFLTLSAGMALSLFAQIGLVAHLFSILAPVLGPQSAGLAMGAATAAAMGGRMFVGWLMPSGADRRLVACMSLSVQIAGSIALASAMGRAPLIWAGVLLFGAGIGNATSLPPLIAQVEFAKEDVARVVALMIAISQAAYAFAPVTFGMIREFSSTLPGLQGAGGAPVFFVTAALVQLSALGAVAFGRRWTR